MKTKTTLITIGILVVGLVAFLIISNMNSPIDKAIEQAKIETEDDQPVPKNEEEPPEEKPVDEEDKEDKEDDVAGKVKDIVTGAVQETVDFFTSNEASVVAIGDSLTQGVGDETGGGGYVGILNEALNTEEETIVTFENYGKRGRRTDQLLKYLEDPKVATSIADADVVLITIGANDIMQVLKENFSNITMDDFTEARKKYEANLKKVFEEIYSLNPNAEVYLLGFYDPFGRYFPQIKELGIIVRNWNLTGKEVTEIYDNATFIPTIDLFADPNTDLFWKDNFHPNYKGYLRIAERVLEYLGKE